MRFSLLLLSGHASALMVDMAPIFVISIKSSKGFKIK
jgi:hypothetical protein